MKKLLQIGNILALVATVYINYLSNTGKMNNTTIGEVSGDLTTLFTPAGYAFSIWGLIYLLLFGFIFYQTRSLFVKVRDDSFVMKIGPWFIFSCIANCFWIYFWIYGYTGWSVFWIFILLLSLLIIVKRNAMELWDAPISVIVFLWWPFVIYSGWVAVASIANVSAYLMKTNWSGWGISETRWTIILIIIAGIINLIITWKRNMREFALVGAWALFAIASANWNTSPTVKWVALGMASILVLSSLMHAIKNLKTNPGIKFLQYLKK